MLTMRALWKVYVRWVVRPAPLHRRAALRDGFHDVYDALSPLRTLAYWLHRPRSWLRLRRMLRAARKGVGFLEA